MFREIEGQSGLAGSRRTDDDDEGDAVGGTQRSPSLVS